MVALKSTRFPSILQLCSYSTSSTSKILPHFNLDLFLSNQIQNLQDLLQWHAYIITTGNTNNGFLAAKLISHYSSFHKPSSSLLVFNSVSSRDTFLWNSIIKTHFSIGQYREALHYYHLMRQSNISPNHFTVPIVVTTCADLILLNYGKNIHGLASKLGLFADNPAIGSSFVHMYSKCGDIRDARLMFEEIPMKDVVAWTALVVGYVQNDESELGLEGLYELHKIGGGSEPKLNFRTLECGFQACGNLGAIHEGRCLHGLAAKTGIGCYSVVQSSLLSMYAKCGSAGEALLSFYEVLDKDIISWTSVIGMYMRLGALDECLRMFSNMEDTQVYPDGILIGCMIMGFGNSTRVLEGKAFHGMIFRRQYLLDEIVHNALLSMYCKFGLLTPAEKLFDQVKKQNKECWNTMVSEYNKMGLERKCIQCFREMQWLSIKYDSNSMVSVISSCSQLRAIRLGRSLHSYIIRQSNCGNISIVNSLINMYGKCGDLTNALKLFHRAKRDVITWNTLISAYTHVGLHTEALNLFDRMVVEDLRPNVATLVSVLSACSHLASLERGHKIHKYINHLCLECSLLVATSLIDMYAKCGDLSSAREIFDSMNERDVTCWNVMISGYGMLGDAKSALGLFWQMDTSGTRPNGITFLAILEACSHAGLVEEGKCLFNIMQDYSVERNLKHYACLVDLLGRSGKLQEAESLVLSMPFPPDGGVWGALLSACKIHNEIDMGIRIAKRAIESDPKNDGYYIMIVNMYSATGRWGEANRMRTLMRENCMEKVAGWSAV